MKLSLIAAIAALAGAGGGANAFVCGVTGCRPRPRGGLGARLSAWGGADPAYAEVGLCLTHTPRTHATYTRTHPVGRRIANDLGVLHRREMTMRSVQMTKHGSDLALKVSDQGSSVKEVSYRQLTRSLTCTLATPTRIKTSSHP